MKSNTNPLDELPIACDYNAVTSEQQEFWMKEIVPNLYPAVQEIQELPNGWAWRLPSTPEMLKLVAEDLNLERLCCPFVHYTLEIERNRGPFWYRMRGGEGVKEFLRMAFAEVNLFDEQVLKAAGLDVSNRTDVDSVQTAIEVMDSVNQRFANELASND